MKRLTRSQRLALMCASSAAIALLFGVSSQSHAQTVTINDTEFNNSDWTEQVSYDDAPADWTYSVQQYTSGGNPDTFRGQTWQYTNNDG
ncbi:MAG TPA: hypothetical protein VGG19_14240, partial [Tepidisphaeraceae bacterium]